MNHLQSQSKSRKRNFNITTIRKEKTLVKFDKLGKSGPSWFESFIKMKMKENQNERAVID